MSKKNILKAGKQVTEIVNKVEFKKKTKKIKKHLKEKLSTQKYNEETSFLAVERKKKLKGSKPKQIIAKIKKLNENIAIKEKLKGIKKKKNKIRGPVLEKINLNLNFNTKDKSESIVTPKKKKFKNKKPKQVLGKVKKLHENIAINEKLLKIKKFKKKNDNQHLLENVEKAGFSTPVRNRLQTHNKISPKIHQKRKKQLEKLQEFVTAQPNPTKPLPTLRQKMMDKLEAARFRFLNEQIYNADGKEAEKMFKSDPSAFQAYHKGFRQQVNRWPLNPLDKIIKMIKKMPTSLVVADFGCGDAKLAQSVQQKVHSFDLVAANEWVTASNMARVPLDDESVDVTVFCLSLMGTNLKDYLLEANRVLKPGGLLKVVEVESRFDNVDEFVKGCKSYGFAKTWMDLSHNLFYFLDFKKTATVKNGKKLSQLSLKPCIYKRR